MTNLEEGKPILRTKGWRFICSWCVSHLARNCGSRIHCSGGGGRRHLALCNAGRVRHSGSPAVDVVSTQSEGTTSTVHVSSSMHVVLQIPKVSLLWYGITTGSTINSEFEYSRYFWHRRIKMFPKD